MEGKQEQAAGSASAAEEGTVAGTEDRSTSHLDPRSVRKVAFRDGPGPRLRQTQLSRTGWHSDRHGIASKDDEPPIQPSKRLKLAARTLNTGDGASTKSSDMAGGAVADTPWWPYVKELDDPEPDALPLVFTHKNEWQHDYYHRIALDEAEAELLLGEYEPVGSFPITPVDEDYLAPPPPPPMDETAVKVQLILGMMLAVASQRGVEAALAAYKAAMLELEQQQQQEHQAALLELEQQQQQEQANRKSRRRRKHHQ